MLLLLMMKTIRRLPTLSSSLLCVASLPCPCWLLWRSIFALQNACLKQPMEQCRRHWGRLRSHNILTWRQQSNRCRQAVPMISKLTTKTAPSPCNDPSLWRDNTVLWSSSKLERASTDWQSVKQYDMLHVKNNFSPDWTSAVEAAEQLYPPFVHFSAGYQEQDCPNEPTRKRIIIKIT